MMSEDKNILAILTLAKHQHGIWIERLVESLQRISSSSSSLAAAASNHHNAAIAIQVVVLEDSLQNPFRVSDNSNCNNTSSSSSSPLNSQLSSNSKRWCGLVNRVSDAAEPWQVKACVALLQLAKHVWKIPIWNGPDAFGLCTHKWCHHMLFGQANLASPPTVAAMMTNSTQQQIGHAPNGSSHDEHDNDDNDGDRLEQKAVGMLQNMQPRGSTAKHTLDYLVKPNAGGFGAGIERRQASIIPSSSSTLSSSSLSESSPVMVNIQIPAVGILPTSYSDKMVIFQNYIQPRDGKIYRVWFLQGRVQCAAERTMDVLSSSVASSGSSSSIITAEENPESQQPASSSISASLASTSEFTSGCGGGMCTLRPAKKTKTIDAPSQPANPNIQPWQVPDLVRKEIEEQLLPVLPDDAHCGSVEFLYSHNKNCGSKERRLYFDLNLLSTLPIGNTVDERDDPWMELATSIWKFIH